MSQAENDTNRSTVPAAAAPDDIRALVREHYGEVARTATTCGPPGCCQPGASVSATAARTLGYGCEESSAAPEGADLGLGCGNPTAIAALREGECVLDLGSGAGFDSFIAARQVGPRGRVIGVDMTADMVHRARANARKIAAANVEFRLGEIEHLPVADGSVDVILSNCVINLSPEKLAVFTEAFRVLRPGGRLAISDVVTTGPVPAELRDQIAALAGCITGAAPVEELRSLLGAAGFVDVTIAITARSAEIVGGWVPGIEHFLAASTIEARKPGPARSEAAAPAERPAEGDGACCAPACCA